jgi:hypothetical protein
VSGFEPPAPEVDLARVPVDVLLARLRFKIDGENAAVTLALLASTHDRGGYKFRELHKSIVEQHALEQ